MIVIPYKRYCLFSLFIIIMLIKNGFECEMGAEMIIE